MPNPTQVLRVLAITGGALLAIIGVRFFLIPEHAARVFGITGAANGFELHHVIAARDIWLGLLAIAFAALKEWRALSLWFGLGVFVCLADAAVVVNSGAKAGPVAFHLGSGVLCLILGGLAHRASRAGSSG